MSDRTRRLAAWLALAGVLSLPGAALRGGGCYRARTIYGTYSAPAYAAPAAVTYAPAYEAPTVYLKAVKAYVSPDYYSSVSDYYRDKVLVDAVAGKTADILKSQQELQSLREEIGLLRRQLFYQNPQQPAPQQQPPYQQQAPQATPEQPVVPQKMPRATGALPAVPDKLQAVVQQSCARCHGATNATAGGGLDLSSLANVPRETRLLCYTLVNTGEMPKGGKPVTDQDTLLFYSWATGRAATPAASAPK